MSYDYSNNYAYDYNDYNNYASADYGQSASGYYSGYGSTMLTQNDLYVNISTIAAMYSALPPNMPTKVSVWVALMKTLSFANTGILQVTAMMVVQWFDPRLTWNSTIFGTNIIQITTSKMWIPEIILLNSANPSQSIATPGAANTATVFNNGVVSLYIPSVYTAYCTLDLTKFPFDSQRCTLTFISFATNTTNPGVTFTLHQNNIPFRFYSTTGELALTNYTLVNRSNLCFTYTCFSNFGLRLFYSRRSSYYVMTVIIPTVLLSILLGLVLIIPSDSVVKITVACTLMLSLYTLQQTVSRLLPATQSPPLLSIGTIISLGLAGFCVIMTILSVVIRMYQPTLGPRLVKFFKSLICEKANVASFRAVAPSVSTNTEARTRVTSGDIIALTDVDMSVDVSKPDKIEDNTKLEKLMIEIANLLKEHQTYRSSKMRATKEADMKRARDMEQNRCWRIMDTSSNIFLFVAYIVTSLVCLVYFEF